MAVKQLPKVTLCTKPLTLTFSSASVPEIVAVYSKFCSSPRLIATIVKWCHQQYACETIRWKSKL